MEKRGYIHPEWTPEESDEKRAASKSINKCIKELDVNDPAYRLSEAVAKISKPKADQK